jgi:phosphatidate phosphatase APP1
MASVLGRSVEGHIPHKEYEIQNILKTYPKMRFILVGDSGEKDADIYLKIAREYPGRIRAIYLRSVKHRSRMQRVRKLTSQETEVPVLIVDRSEEVAEHARGMGLI